MNDVRPIRFTSAQSTAYYDAYARVVPKRDRPLAIRARTVALAEGSVAQSRQEAVIRLWRAAAKRRKRQRWHEHAQRLNGAIHE